MLRKPIVSLAVLPSLFHLIFSVACRADESFDPERFEKTVLVTGLNQPMEMAIAPDGRIFFIEIAGQLKVLDPKTNSVTPVGQLTVTTANENGLIGIVLDPDFAKNHWIYLQYSPPDYPGQHISRFTERDGKIDMQSEVLILKFEEQRQECCHHAGSMEFGLDGNLYIGTGDNTNPFGDSQGFAPIDERDERSAFNALRTSSNTKSHNGKVLRIKPLPEGGYSIPDGNLFPRDGSIGLPEIYVMGCRNPWRINIDRKTGYLYWGDVGPDAGNDGPRGSQGYDEVNQAKKAGYFGWPLFIGANSPYVRVDFKNGDIGETFDPNHPVNRSRFNSGAIELPPAQPAWIYYPYGQSDRFPELGTGGRTACAGPSYDFDSKLSSSTKFPKYFDRTLFIFEWSRNWIAAVHLNDDSSIRKIERFLPEMPFIRPIDMQFDANGSLLVIEYGETWGVNPEARLVRIDYRTGNRPPMARVAASTTAGREPLIVHVSAAETKDKDGDKLAYRWKSIPAGSDASQAKWVAQGSEADLRFDSPGVFNLQLEVDDGNGGADVATLPIVVGNSIPEVRFVGPADGDFYDLGESISYQVVVTDLEDGTSDVDLSNSSDYEFIDTGAPDRVTVQASIVTSENDKAAALESAPPGLKLMRGSDCFNCHAVDRQIVGPAFLDVANKYRDQPNALNQSVERVTKGSSGVWGKVPMLAHSQHTPEQIREMVTWVYSVKPDPSSQSVRGITNRITLLESKPDLKGMLRLTANYTDLGRDMVPPLTGTSSITLRSRTIEAEQADMIHRMSELGAHNASNGKFLGSIEHGSYIQLKSIPMHVVGGITVSVASAGAGGDIVIHADKIDGPVLGQIHVDVNGDWVGWYQRSAAFQPTDRVTDLFLECVNPNHGGLMNIDWVRFDKRP